jgi:hypothetical protein
LTKRKSDRRKRASTDIDPPPPPDEPGGDGGPDEAAAFIAETVSDLAGLAQHHGLEMLSRLLRMSQLEAEEHLRLRSKSKLS